MNRRNLLLGLGTVVASGGAALGSGAFSTADANRELEVNVVTDTAIAEEFVDIILNDVGTTDTLAVDDGSGTDATALFPTSDTSEGDYNNYTPDPNDVSLMQNDVTIVFGPTDNGLPPNSTVGYDGLITVVNEEGNTSQDFDVSFTVEDSSGDPSPNVDFQWVDNGDFTVDSNSSEDVDVDVTTDGETSTGTLVITIEESP
ncbi:hypothetical protein HTG_14815 [Natrinema mahii]|nr:hypothetical protein HTG_14815 [Natrinema mahii]